MGSEKNTKVLGAFVDGGTSASLAPANSFLESGRQPFKSRAHQRVFVGNAEPPVVALVKQVLNPSVIVFSLLLCALAYAQPFTPPYIALALLAFIIASQVFGEVELIPLPRRHPLNFIGRGILLEWMLVIAILLLMAFAIKVSDLFSRKVLLTWFTVTPLVLVASHAVARRTMCWLVDNGSVVRTHLIVGANEVGCELARKLNEDPCFGTVKGFFDDRKLDRLASIKQNQLLGSLADIANYVRTHSINVIYISLPITAEPRILKLLDELRDTTASIYFVPDIFMFDLIQARFVDVNGIPVVAICETPFCGMNGVLKRTSDLAFAGAMILLLWPLMLAIAIGVKLSSPGPVFFRQRRYGLDGEEIVIYKFRTMTVCEDGGPIVQATKGDQRVTRFGGFLRRTSLDELPQILNVLQNKMSVVGPRPHAVAHNEQYRKLINGYMLRHKVRPGITGWAQVNGLRGETETIDKMKARVEYDLDYLRNWSLWLDIKIIARTALIVLRDRNAY
ncbi:MAG TPA: undecaprenyl-phosphate glucose phosphotransferase [Burkholderiales bacterium]|nr:undecaprenyl-phosphate glucose phosphotransferase [Burkholderiales bacterium]